MVLSANAANLQDSLQDRERRGGGGERERKNMYIYRSTEMQRLLLKSYRNKTILGEIYEKQVAAQEDREHQL